MIKDPAMKNYYEEHKKILLEIRREGRRPSLLLHSCCAPCSSYVLEYLSAFFDITVYYYNPNITDKDEYEKRLAEQRRLLDLYNREVGTRAGTQPGGTQPEGVQPEGVRPGGIRFLPGAYEPGRFFETVKGMEELPEGSLRCFACYELRMSEAAMRAKEGGFDYFTTTLSVSPHKNAGELNGIGEKLSRVTGVKYLPADFKKQDGYKRSIELSKRYGLYRQDYCGCLYSRARERKIFRALAEK